MHRATAFGYFVVLATVAALNYVPGITRPDGAVFARVERKGRAVRIAFSPDVDPAFIARLTARLKDDYAAFLAAGNGGEAGKD